MNRTRFLLNVTFSVATLGGALMLATPAAAAASSTGCTSGQILDAKSSLGQMCDGNGGSGYIHCHEDGSYHWDSYSCNSPQ